MKIFKKVHCKAYLKKYQDGVHLWCVRVSDGKWGEMTEPVTGSSWRDGENIRVTAIQDVYENGKWDTKELKDLSNFDGESVEKVYRKRTEEEFDGFLVGITKIVVTGRIGTDYSEHPYNMSGDLEGVWHLTKERDYQKVGVVYFKNNAKRYVLMDDMEVIG